MTTPEFRPWPKTPRLFKDVTITEKIDGTNAGLHINEDGEVFAQSRKRLLPMGPRGLDDLSWEKEDNFGFAKWARNNSQALAETLGVGTHFGEWWGHGIQRGYRCEPGERYFSLFNTNKWGFLRDSSPVDSLSVVPVLWTGTMDTAAVLDVADNLRDTGSYAKHGFYNPEGVCIFHSASNQIFKYPFDKTEGRGAVPAVTWNERLTPRVVEKPKSFTQRVKEIFWLAA